MIERKKYLDTLISKKENGLIKVITGIRRCGKSYLLSTIYKEYLTSIGVDDEHIIQLPLDEIEFAKYRNPMELDKHIKEIVSRDTGMFYIFIDEIQKVVEINNPFIDDKNDKIGFVDVLLGLMKINNVDLYVTGSNSRLLSSEILTEFRDRGDEIKMSPLTYKEFYSYYKGNKNSAWKDYYTYGGMPQAVLRNTHEEKSKYLKRLFEKTYMSDVIERNGIQNESMVLGELVNIISSSIGSLTNSLKLANTFKSVKKVSISPNTINDYLSYLVDAFIIDKAYKYDIKGKKYIDTPLKYYFTDIGLRNARLNFRQQEESHIMENIIFNELKAREYDIDIGVVEYNYKNDKGVSQRSQLEIDFIANKSSKRYYIQSALLIESEEKRYQETTSLRKIPDSFKKIIVLKDNINPWYDENGILYIGIEQFLLDESAVKL
ncbi:MAG: ATP-binding protein [Endomicrobium sp.]|jgi:predicted AAA+ superfamily ATPase|nr:ATP-binding protein [Endomicrobium sp.]